MIAQARPLQSHGTELLLHSIVEVYKVYLHLEQEKESPYWSIMTINLILFLTEYVTGVY